MDPPMRVAGPRTLDGRVVSYTFYHLMDCYLQHFLRCTGIYSTFLLLIAKKDDPLWMLGRMMFLGSRGCFIWH